MIGRSVGEVNRFIKRVGSFVKLWRVRCLAEVSLASLVCLNVNYIGVELVDNNIYTYKIDREGNILSRAILFTVKGQSKSV